MLVKYRGLTLIGGFAMAVAIAIGATVFEALSEMITPALPFEGGERVVSLHTRYRTRRTGSARCSTTSPGGERSSLPSRISPHSAPSNTISRHRYAPPEPVKLAEMTASGFAVASTAPLLGRYLLAADEQPGASPVVVVGYQESERCTAAHPKAESASKITVAFVRPWRIHAKPLRCEDSSPARSS